MLQQNRNEKIDRLVHHPDHDYMVHAGYKDPEGSIQAYCDSPRSGFQTFRLAPDREYKAIVQYCNNCKDVLGRFEWLHFHNWYIMVDPAGYPYKEPTEGSENV